MSRPSRFPLIALVVAVLLVAGAVAAWYLAHPAPPRLEPLRHQLAEWIGAHRCALLDGTVRADGTVSVTGLAGEADAPTMRQNLNTIVRADALDWHVATVATVFCPVLDALRPAARTDLSLAMPDGPRLRDGDLVRVRLTTPDYAASLRVDFIVHDGSVQHLYPQLADAKARIAADPPRVFAAHQSIDLVNPAWTIGEPYGTDLIIAVASSEPLFPALRHANAETIDTYARDLAAAIRAAKANGTLVSATAISLETLPKQ